MNGLKYSDMSLGITDRLHSSIYVTLIALTKRVENAT